MSGPVSAHLHSVIRYTTDATRGQPLASRVLARKDELEHALADLGPDDGLLRVAIETALATVTALMTGDLAHPSAVISLDLSRWLERRKLLAQDITRAQRAAGDEVHAIGGSLGRERLGVP